MCVSQRGSLWRMRMYCSIFPWEPPQPSTSETWEPRSAGSRWVQAEDGSGQTVPDKPIYIKWDQAELYWDFPPECVRCFLMTLRLICCSASCKVLKLHWLCWELEEGQRQEKPSEDISLSNTSITKSLPSFLSGLSDRVYRPFGHLSDVLLQGSLHLRTQIWLYHQ